MKREELNFYLQKAPEEQLCSLSSQIEEKARVVIIQKPTQQTLLLPVKDPINRGTFISGEVLVTSAIVQVNGTSGWAMVMDQQEKLARIIAVLDGAFAATISTDEIRALAEKGREKHNEELREENEKIAKTRVSFDLM